jgi:hypothetical protein
MNRSRLRTVAATIGLLVLPACSGGINAGEQGGRAFIAFTVMLLVTLGALWLAIGRGD